MTVALTGFMGSGKTLTGRVLAHRLGWDFTDLDEEIEKAAGKPVGKIFEDEGEAAFRALEARMLADVLGDSRSEPGMTDRPERNLVLALGGGTILRGESAEMVKNRCVCVWLEASEDTLAEHLSGKESCRPLLAGRELRSRIRALLSQREEAYRNAADITVCTDSLTPEEAAERIEIEIKKL